MANSQISSLISLTVAICILVASYFQWYDVTYNGQTPVRAWAKIFFGFCIFALVVAVGLIVRN